MSEIRVLITNKAGSSESIESSSTKVSSNIVDKNGKIKSKEVKESGKSSQALAVASMVASQSFNFMTSNVGKWTGSTKAQTTVNNAMQLVGLGAMAYINPYIALATAAINIGTTAIDTAYEQKWDTRNSEYQKARVGELKGRGHR